MTVKSTTEHTLATPLYRFHFEIAVRAAIAADCLKERTSTENLVEWQELTLHAINGVIHAHCAIESLAGLQIHQRYKNPLSSNYQDPDTLPLPEKFFIDRLRNVGVADKIRFASEHCLGITLESTIIGKCRELQQLRNVLVHSGAFLETTKVFDGDWSYSDFQGFEFGGKPWKKYFKLTKFNPPREGDAWNIAIALQITLDVFSQWQPSFTEIDCLYPNPDGNSVIRGSEIHWDVRNFLSTIRPRAG